MISPPLDNIAYMELAHDLRPSLTYRPGREFDLEGREIDQRDNGQLQLHSASHVFRLAAPGNGWGKTTLAAVEVDWWGHGFHPYQQLPPTVGDRPRVLLWVCQKFQQWEVMRGDVERWWPDDVRLSWHSQHHSYTWPNGTRMFVFTAESEWETLQGGQPSLAVVDEECGAGLWHELTRRRRGTIETDLRYLITATATQGLTWTYRELYLPWLKYHAELGLDEQAAMRAQRHVIEGTQTPGIFVWPRGSHRDNPIATRDSWAYQVSLPAGSKAEREVRLYGGYREFAGQPVFDQDALEAMRAKLSKGEAGWFQEIKT